MTTDITELAQSLKAAAEKWQEAWGKYDKVEITIAEFIRAAEQYESIVKDPANVLALVEALEKAQAENEYIRKRYQQLDLLIGKNILVMQAAIIEWQATGDAKNGLAWIYNTLFGPGELPDEAEKDAQAYFDRKYAPLDEELMALHKWFWEQSEAERAAAGIEVEAEKIRIVLQELKEDGVLTTYSNGHVEMLPYRIDENGEEYVEMFPNDIELH
ncbi:ead/Ea22-like family protein [Klebsiella quasipneumoniae subsp. similipneumoniae]|nr:ead/Ea22-like family protein [Klebsiella quasipneumoniae]MDV0652237.1 ead/Ea22-like family protein [Klebsiella quasipneumoniae subsp. similipneumoniae]